MRVLVIGSGGREHALCWKISKSDLVKKIYCAPGNSGIEKIAQCVDISPSSIDKLLSFASSEKIDLTIVGPELPLVNGLVDVFQSAELRIFGPTKACAQVEGSKVYAKNLLRKYGIPTANFKTFDDYLLASNYLKNCDYPVVIKADGLAAGKGVIIAYSQKEATDAIKQMMIDRVFNEAGNKVIIEEFYSGYEVSIMAFVDGKTTLVMEPSHDYKKLYEYDKGPNTGGMGAYSPVPSLTNSDYRKIISKIITPWLYALNREGLYYKGILYAGIMITKTGPKVLEFNARLGDPEAQVVLTRIKSDIIPIINATIDGKLDDMEGNEVDWDNRVAICTVLVSGGYPSKFETGHEITGLDVNISENTFIFHAGTNSRDGKHFTTGGRVLNVVSLANDFNTASENTHSALKNISFKNMYYRKDIGSFSSNPLPVHK